MKATFTGGPDDQVSSDTTVFGLIFPRDKAVDVSDLNPLQQAKLQGNPTFEVADDGAAKKGRGKAAQAVAPVSDLVDIPPSWETFDDAALHELAAKIDPTLDVDATRETSAETVKAELDRRAAP